MLMMSFDTFAPHMRETFSLSLGEASVDMTLVDAQRGRAREVAGLRKEPFNLYFKSQSHVVLPQRIYPFYNLGLGRFDIFIVPIARDKDGILYEAVFN